MDLNKPNYVKGKYLKPMGDYGKEIITPGTVTVKMMPENNIEEIVKKISDEINNPPKKGSLYMAMNMGLR